MGSYGQRLDIVFTGWTHIILVRIYRLGVKAYFPNLLVLFNVLTDPDVPIEPKYNIHPTRQGAKVRFQTFDQNGWNGYHLPIAQLG